MTRIHLQVTLSFNHCSVLTSYCFMAHLLDFIMMFNINAKWPRGVAVALVFNHRIIIMWFHMFWNINQDIIIRKNGHPCMKDWKECRLILNSLDIYTLHKNTNIKRLAGKTPVTHMDSVRVWRNRLPDLTDLWTLVYQN